MGKRQARKNPRDCGKHGAQKKQVYATAKASQRRQSGVGVGRGVSSQPREHLDTAGVLVTITRDWWYFWEPQEPASGGSPLLLY